MSYSIKVKGRFFDTVYRNVVLHSIDARNANGAQICERLVLTLADKTLVSIGNIWRRDFEILPDYQAHKEEQNGVQSTGISEGSN